MHGAQMRAFIRTKYFEMHVRSTLTQLTSICYAVKILIYLQIYYHSAYTPKMIFKKIPEMRLTVMQKAVFKGY